jgi:SMC interacting uncharacterized protein involved in chromosome segregation
MSNENLNVEEKVLRPKSNATKADLIKYIEHLEIQDNKLVDKLGKANKRIVDKDNFIQTLKDNISKLEKENSNNNTLKQSQFNILKQELEETKTLLKKRVSEIDRFNKIPSWIRRIYGAN